MNDKKSRVIVIVGPTASGKTSLSIKLAKKINGEIISADSMQIYRDMNIGTAKPTFSEMDGINHYMIDILNPDEEFNVSKYKEMAENFIEEILAKGKNPIIVGGTGLYVSTLTNGIEFTEIAHDEEYVKSLEEIAKKENGINILFEKLKKIDEASSNVIDKNNVRRVIRALEIYKITGKTKTEIDRESIKGPKYDYKIFAIDWDREILYDRINLRVDLMLKDGLIDEVENIRKKYEISSTAIQGLGYKEVIEYLENKISYDEMVEKLKLETRRYAKRQLTWFRKDKNIIWLKPENSYEELIREIN